MMVTRREGRWHLSWCHAGGTKLFLRWHLPPSKPQHFVGWGKSHRGSQSLISPGILYLLSCFGFSWSPRLADLAF